MFHAAGACRRRLAAIGGRDDILIRGAAAARARPFSEKTCRCRPDRNFYSAERVCCGRGKVLLNVFTRGNKQKRQMPPWLGIRRSVCRCPRVRSRGTPLKIYQRLFAAILTGCLLLFLLCFLLRGFLFLRFLLCHVCTSSRSSVRCCEEIHKRLTIFYTR